MHLSTLDAQPRPALGFASRNGHHNRSELGLALVPRELSMEDIMKDVELINAGQAP